MIRAPSAKSVSRETPQHVSRELRIPIPGPATYATRPVRIHGSSEERGIRARNGILWVSR